ncbi:LysR family transcriptional regulator [Pusillimonas sp. T7-7]|uniref:LysR family transcriptional regulator n=1 Tax=Pusillimonas sp. (strain T7-7) TaxID=1007105 RepID=UPI0002085436|nr:LysR family transcriptional regulator [Pusillimonas sp. T7-7]AEC20768.1 LysR family transcriptional regulator [Pusillimonas sp. T7-7]
MTQTLRPAWLLRSRLKIRQLQLLSSLGETGNLHRSAVQLSMAQPTATKLLQQLEAVLEVELFERSKRGMAPTTHGLAMIRHARCLLADLDAARDEMHALSEGSSGTLTVGIMVSSASTILPRAIAELACSHSHLRIAVKEGTHAMLIASIQRGDMDFALGRVMHGAGMEYLNYELLYMEEYCVVSGVGHPLAARRQLSLHMITEQRWVLPPSSMPLRQRFDTMLLAELGRRPRNVLESVSLLFNLQLLQEGNMLALMPVEIARHFAASKQLRILPVPLDGFFGPVGLITRGGRRLSPAAQTLVDELKRIAGDSGWHAKR